MVFGQTREVKSISDTVLCSPKTGAISKSILWEARSQDCYSFHVFFQTPDGILFLKNKAPLYVVLAGSNLHNISKTFFMVLPDGTLQNNRQPLFSSQDEQQESLISLFNSGDISMVISE